MKASAIPTPVGKKSNAGQILRTAKNPKSLVTDAGHPIVCEGYYLNHEERPLHNRHSGPRAGIQGWGFRIEPHAHSTQSGLSLAVMQRPPRAGTSRVSAPMSPPCRPSCQTEAESRYGECHTHSPSPSQGSLGTAYASPYSVTFTKARLSDPSRAIVNSITSPSSAQYLSLFGTVTAILEPVGDQDAAAPRHSSGPTNTA